jgi:hypothetical protein
LLLRNSSRHQDRCRDAEADGRRKGFSGHEAPFSNLQINGSQWLIVVWPPMRFGAMLEDQ